MILQDIKTEQDILDFIEGSLNDFESGEASKNETITNVVELITFASKRYATACVKASQEKIDKDIRLQFEHEDGLDPSDIAHISYIITYPDNIVLL